MRKSAPIGTLILAALVAGSSPQLRAGGGDDAKASEIIAATRKALGGDQKHESLKALSVRAEFRREQSTVIRGGTTFVAIGGGGSIGDGGGQTTGSIEMDLLWPDRYYRQETSTGGFSVTRIEGFEGERPFLDLISNSPGTRVTSNNPASDPTRTKESLKRMNAEVGRLLLGLIGGTQPGLPVTCTYVGQAEAPDGKADVLDVAGPDDFKARLFLDSSTHLPLMLTYMEPDVVPMRMMTQRPAGGSAGTTTTVTHGGATTSGAAGAAGSAAAQLTPEQQAEIEKQLKAAQAAPPKLVERRLYFADYRAVDGLMLPHRISRGSAEKTTEEWDVKSYKVNPNIKADRFKVGTD